MARADQPGGTGGKGESAATAAAAPRPRRQLRLLTAFAATGFAAEAVPGAADGIADMLGIAVASGDGGPDVPA